MKEIIKETQERPGWGGGRKNILEKQGLPDWRTLPLTEQDWELWTGHWG